MKKHYSLTRRLALCLALGALFVPVSVQTAQADAITSDETATVTTTVYVGTKNGTLSANYASSSYYNKWQSTNLSALTLECSSNNMANSSDTIALYSGGTSCTYNLNAADGWKIKSISLELKNRYNDEVGTTVTLNGGTAQTITYDKQTLTATDLSATTVPIVVTKGTTQSSSSSNGNWVLISNCSVTLERSTTGRALTVDMSNGTLNNGTGYSSLWKSTSTAPAYILKASANNMQANGTAIDLYAGSSKSSTYLFSTSKEYAVAGYFLTFKNKATSSSTVTLTANGTAYTVSDSTQTVFVEGLDYPATSWTLAGDNHAVLFSNIQVILKPRTNADGFTELFVTDYTSAHPYRIPAVAKTYNGDLLALSDYRVCGADIGNGEVDIVARRSTDNGKTWGTQFTIADGSSTCGYGDAALVADRESNNVLLICVSGKITYWNSSSTNRMPISRFTSSDNGETWTKQSDLTDDIYNLFTGSSLGEVAACFFGSGRICQSQVVKVGNYYRLYAALCSRPGGNRVIYSDDFGATWKALGDINTSPATSGDEPKCEELPDGTVILSSRVSGGRYFNFYTYTDVEKAEGNWGTVAFSGTSNSGAYTNGNSTNGEILILPATRNSDGKEVYVALQSVPLGSSRSNVTIHYKELSSLDDVKDPSAFASNWDGHLQVSTISSAYSTMILQANDSIAFLFEEATYGYDYTTLYKAYSLEDITNNAYTYKSSVDRNAWVHDILKERVASLSTGTEAGMALGMQSPTSVSASTESADANAVVTTYDNNPTAQGYADAMAAYAKLSASTGATYNTPVSGRTYILTNRNFTTYRMKLKSTTTSSATTYSYVGVTDGVDASQKFQLVSSDETANTWYIYNDSLKVYMCASPSTSSQFTGTTDKSSAGTFTLTSSTSGYTYFTSSTSSGYSYAHLDASKNVVAWEPNNNSTQWVITPVDEADSIRTVLIDSINLSRDYVIGTSLGTYTDANSAFSTALSTAAATANNLESDSTALASALKTLKSGISSLTLNQPTAGMFLRIRTTKESRSAQPYLLPYNVASSVKADRLALGSGSETETIFYYTGGNLLSYYNGYYLTNTYITTGGTTEETNSMALFNGIATGATVSFPAATTGTTVGYYNLKYASNRYLYANLSGTTYYADAWRGSGGAEQCNFEIEEVTSLPVTITAAGWATFYAPVTLAIPEGVTAYYSEKVDDYLQLHALTDGVVPANTPVLLQGDAGTYYFTTTSTATSTTADESSSYGDGTLVGTLAAIPSAYANNNTTYDLTLQNPSTGIGFYRYKGSEIRGFSAYIPSGNASGVKGMNISLTPTAIEHVETTPSTQNDAIYDLQGRRVNKTGRGIYIIGGKKVICL